VRPRRAALAAILVAVAFLLGCESDAAPALDLSAQPPSVVARYRFIAAHQALAEQVTCYCGCGPELQHRQLRDCFVRDDGSFEPHGGGCGICQSEAILVERLDGQGMASGAIAARVDEQFAQAGPPTRPTARSAG
jgi:hypothetical protein